MVYAGEPTNWVSFPIPAAQSRPPIRGNTGPTARGAGGRPGSGNDRKVIEQMDALQAQIQDHEDQLNNMKEQVWALSSSTLTPTINVDTVFIP